MDLLKWNLSRITRLMTYITVSSLSTYMHPASLAFNNDTELWEETVLAAEAPLCPLSSSRDEEAVLCLLVERLVSLRTKWCHGLPLPSHTCMAGQLNDTLLSAHHCRGARRTSTTCQWIISVKYGSLWLHRANAALLTSNGKFEMFITSVPPTEGWWFETISHEKSDLLLAWLLYMEQHLVWEIFWNKSGPSKGWCAAPGKVLFEGKRYC